MTDTPLLAGRGAVVVGGSRGIGRAVAGLLAANGAGVVVNGRDADAAAEAAAAICADGGRAVAHPGPAADEAVARSLVDACAAEYGRIDILINCAGAPEPPGSSILNISTAEFRDLMSAHLGTVFATCRAAAPVMVDQGAGAIVNTSSAAFLGDYGGTGYPAGKGAVNSLTLAIAAELREHGVRANVVCPGARTRLNTSPEYEEHIRKLHRRGILDDTMMRVSLDVPPPAYVAPTYVYLASELARDVTGQIFAAAGGFVGHYERATPTLLGYRDHRDSPPWPVAEVHRMVGAREARSV
ncbi:SDR family oxidoreductase [Mycobacterium sp.]|uniref:SDR family NAD(P)-dependent oxidoreductase n=1 Tax=Mycobacterium sp. TaxID=1785 RepID=UPI002CD9EF7C|nr:SDR family oxidoreductase [Mycobacterium sp.]HME47712.1 SDR family oxidoreductase [Mycobacterium sp.]